MKFFIASAFLLLSLNAHAELIVGRIISVSDGDTVTLLTPQKQSIKIRLNAIGAPEKAQNFGNASKKSLSDLCFGKDARVDAYSLDKYRRTIGDLHCLTPSGEYVSANSHQVQNGMAWVYRQYSKDANLIKLETDVKAANIGIWSQPDPIPPWDFRHGGIKKIVNVTAEATSLNVGSGFTCAGKRFCKQMTSCEEAKFYLNVCGVSRLDGNGDGVPCESIC